MPTALITGGAKGIGLAIAKKLKKSGYNVVINYFSSETAAAKLAEEGYFTVRADVSEPGEVDRLFSAVRNKFGRVDLLAFLNGLVRLSASPLMPSSSKVKSREASPLRSIS